MRIPVNIEAWIGTPQGESKKNESQLKNTELEKPL
jgi:hypothetical protein